ncbi:MAG: hypothetical protein J5781_00170 [Clostridia bacterium]|nr:hypothetical protein [Clostridia bacterium]
MQTLKVVVTDYWFDKIKSGKKKHEYRRFSNYWLKRLTFVSVDLSAIDFRRFRPFEFIEFQRAYRKNPERMTFKIKRIGLLITGMHTDLKCEDPVFDIEFSERVK